MNWDAIGAVGEILGAAAVVVTLIYLAAQLRQNTNSMQAAAYNTWADNRAKWQDAMNLVWLHSNRGGCVVDP